MSQQQPTSFARVILTPILLLIAAALPSQIVPGYTIVLLAGAAIIGIAYILVASRRGR